MAYIDDIVCFPKLSHQWNIDVYVLIHKWHDIYNYVLKENPRDPPQTLYKQAHQRLENWIKAYKIEHYSFGKVRE